MQKFNYQKSNKATRKIYIGLDHGYGNIKTAHRVFQTGIECYDEEPIVSTNYVKYRDKYYVIGESVRRHIVGGTNRTLISANLPSRSCRTGTCRRLSAA